MNPETKWGKALTVVAWTLIVVSGLRLAAGIVGSVFCDCLMINLGDLLIIYAARRVLCRSEGRRKLLLFFLWLQFSTFLLVLLFWSRAATTPMVSSSVRTILFWIILVQAVLYAGCLFVLHHPKVKALFRNLAPVQDDLSDSERK